MSDSAVMKSRLEKDRFPERFCPDVGCLTRTNGGPCREHAPEMIHTMRQDDIFFAEECEQIETETEES
jgi:hypothetical protein